VHTTDRIFTLATSAGGFADFIKTHVFPAVASVAYRNDGTREFIFRMLSQTTLHYRDGPLSRGRAGAIHGGDRLPWLAPPVDNIEPLSHIGWQVHVAGIASPEMRAWCRRHGVTLHVFDWTAAHGKAGFARDAAYLLRPDTWVALADPLGSPDTLDKYFAALGYAFAQEAATSRQPA
jgi:hypothetical protein